MTHAKYSVNKWIAGVAGFLSTALSPLLMPTYGTFLVLWVSVLCLLPIGRRVAVLLVCMGITCILPLIFLNVLRHFKLIRNLNIVDRRQRLLPYLFSALCYAAAAYYLLVICHAPLWFAMFMIGSMVTVLVLAVINIWWKISAHMGGMGGIIALIYQIHVMGLSAMDLFWLLCLAVMVAGLLGTARLALRRHDLWQVLAGAAVGFLCMSLTMRLLG